MTAEGIRTAVLFPHFFTTVLIAADLLVSTVYLHDDTGVRSVSTACWRGPKCRPLIPGGQPLEWVPQGAIPCCLDQVLNRACILYRLCSIQFRAISFTGAMIAARDASSQRA